MTTADDDETTDVVAADPLRGGPVAKAIRAQVRDVIGAALDEGLAAPHLVNVVAGSSAPSLAYLDAIDRTAAKLGIRSSRIELPADASQDDVVDAIRRAGDDDDVHGLMLQFPLPPGVARDVVADAIPLRKDVDGLGTAALGEVFAGRRRHVGPATAAAVVELLTSDPRCAPDGRHVVIMGRSLVVGRPLAAMLSAGGGLHGNATVTLCHRHTDDVAAHTRRADIVVVATGVRGVLTRDMLRPGATVVDVGIHEVVRDDGSTTLVGDVDPGVADVAGLLTPVPGGVGPVTNAVLMRHVAAACHPGRLPAAW